MHNVFLNDLLFKVSSETKIRPTVKLFVFFKAITELNKLHMETLVPLLPASFRSAHLRTVINGPGTGSLIFVL